MCGCILPACVLCLGGKVEVCGWSSVGGEWCAAGMYIQHTLIGVGCCVDDGSCCGRGEQCWIGGLYIERVRWLEVDAL